MTGPGPEPRPGIEPGPGHRLEPGIEPGPDPRSGPVPGAAPERWLVVMERAYRGAVESQYADGLNFIQDLHRQSGGCDLALRGAAVGYALETGFEPSVRIGHRTLDTLPDPRAAVRRMLADGMTVLVEEDGLAALGRTARDRLLPGVRVVGSGELAASWPSYTQVWFL